MPNIDFQNGFGLGLLTKGLLGIEVPNLDNLTLNDDGSYTLVDEKGNSHTIDVVENEGSITNITYDNNNVEIEYDNQGNLIRLGDIDIDVDLYPEPPTSIGYTVTFQVDGDTYYIAECLEGDTISEPPAPTKVGETFTGWYDGESNLITFPYTPSADITLNGQFATARVEMQIDTNGSLCTYNGNSVVNSGTDFVIAGLDSSGNHRYLYIMSKSAMSITGTTLASTGTYDYNGETWYYGCIWGSSSDTSDINNKVYVIPNPPSQIVQNIKIVLDHYYYAD